ncbi:MAG: DUF4338 domain-containing protein [Candidatus Schekmanbacteria bacterium]|nr:DUF4338 domain-containing protein [Candidatus Schekmanbacteria bacterium]
MGARQRVSQVKGQHPCWSSCRRCGSWPGATSFCIAGRPACHCSPCSPVQGDLSRVRPLDFRQVRRTGEERFFDSMIETHHYLGYTRPVGENLKFLVYALGRPITLPEGEGRRGARRWIRTRAYG